MWRLETKPVTVRRRLNIVQIDPFHIVESQLSSVLALFARQSSTWLCINDAPSVPTLLDAVSILYTCALGSCRDVHIGGFSAFMKF